MNPQHNPQWGTSTAYSSQSMANIGMNGVSLGSYGQQQSSMGAFPQSQGNISPGIMKGGDIYSGNPYGGNLYEGGKNFQSPTLGQQAPSFSIDPNQFKPYEKQ